MKIQIYITSIIILLIASCSEEELEPKFLNVDNFSITIPNNPIEGRVLGAISATTNQTNLAYTISSQTPVGALAINTHTGLLIVNNETLFDFKTNPSITGTVVVSSGDLSETANITITLDELNEYELSVVDYFKEIALGFEFGNASEITRRWTTNMRVFVGGSTISELLSELDIIISEINELSTTGFIIETVNDTIQSNFYIYFGSGNSYAEIFPSLSNIVGSNFGLFSIFWNASNELYTGYMYVDIFRANRTEQKHLLREELTQALGLGKDSERFPESIFQQAFSTITTEYAQIDKDLIRLLYHPSMSIGLNRNQVDQVLRNILTNE